MRCSLATLLSAATLTHSAAINPRSPAGGAQSIPDTPPKKFTDGAAPLDGEPPQDTTAPVPDIYGARDIDLPFYRLYHGSMKFFSAGQLNTPNKDTDMALDAGGVDNANQSACGIPDNAFSDSKVAIHPYFLKYADLSRYCEQDVCISFWREDGRSDMMLKVTDICSTDANDPTHCTTPNDIKIDRSKAKVMEKISGVPTGDTYPEQVWWYVCFFWRPPYRISLSLMTSADLVVMGAGSSPNAGMMDLPSPLTRIIGSQSLICPTISTGPSPLH